MLRIVLALAPGALLAARRVVALARRALLARDRFVFETARRVGVPVMWVLAGGYTPDIRKVVRVHLNTARAAVETFLPTRPAT